MLSLIINRNGGLFMSKTTTNWKKLIHTCRVSGLSNLKWCKENNISYSAFYYHLRRLQQKETNEVVPNNKKSSTFMEQEVVQLNFASEEVPQCNSQLLLEEVPQCNPQLLLEEDSHTAITLQFQHVHVAISNSANALVIQNTITALQQLC